MAEVAVEEEVLEQRERKPRRGAPEANGHASDVPDFNAAQDFAAPEGLAGDSTDVPEPEDVEDTSTAVTKIYFVRMPRPPINDELVKKLSAQFAEQVTKLKALNAKLSVKREELRELYRQKDAGYSLKGDSQPEFTEKVTRRNQLRDVRNNYQKKISSIKENLRGLDCKSESELDAKVKELEERITHGSLPLREEKLLVGQISKLQAQRNQVRDYDNQKSSLVELESELEKVLAVLEELEKEVDILIKEREQAKGIIQGIKAKVDTCKAELKEMEEEQEAAVAAKNDALAALDKARNEMNESMVDYRENRSFSLKVRDLVTAGQVEEASALCAAQMDDVVGKIASDTAFRKEYYKLWAAQRKYAVSELLPDSTAVVREAKPDQGKGGGGKGGKGDAKARAPPPKPQGAEKARLLIEQLMAEAQAEASRKAGPRPPADDAQSSGDADDELDAPGPAPAAAAVTLPTVEAAKPKAAAASARPADVLKAVELPSIPDEEFVPPVVKSAADKAAATAAQDKERLRAEQLKKAQEAELRKKKLAEAKEKKRKEAEAKRKVEEEQRKVEEAEAAAERARKAAAEKAEVEAKRKAAEAAAKAAADAKALSSNPAAKVIAKSQVTVAAKAKPAGNDPLRYWKLVKKNTNLQLIILAVVLSIIMLALVVMAMRS